MQRGRSFRFFALALAVLAGHLAHADLGSVEPTSPDPVPTAEENPASQAVVAPPVEEREAASGVRRPWPIRSLVGSTAYVLDPGDGEMGFRLGGDLIEANILATEIAYDRGLSEAWTVGVTVFPLRVGSPYLAALGGLQARARWNFANREEWSFAWIPSLETNLASGSSFRPVQVVESELVASRVGETGNKWHFALRGYATPFQLRTSTPYGTSHWLAFGARLSAAREWRVSEGGVFSWITALGANIIGGELAYLGETDLGYGGLTSGVGYAHYWDQLGLFVSWQGGLLAARIKSAGFAAPSPITAFQLGGSYRF